VPVDIATGTKLVYTYHKGMQMKMFGKVIYLSSLMYLVHIMLTAIETQSWAMVAFCVLFGATLSTMVKN
jgi:hypothetical protein